LLRTHNRALDAAIEQQRRVEAELRSSQARLRAILRDSPDAIALYDVNSGRCDILNRIVFLGHRIDEFDIPNGLIDRMHPDDRDDAQVHLDRLPSLGADQVVETTVRIAASDGADRFVRLRFSPVSATVESTPTMLCMLGDVTEDWENQLRESELHEALRRAQRLEAVGQLAGGIAHDFNNVLAAILASAELLAGEIPDGRPEEYRSEIERAAQRGAALTRQLLTYAHRDRTEPRSVDLGDVVLGLEPLLRRTIGTGVQLQLTTPDEPLNVLADPTHLEQVVVNLVLNARDAMPDGGVLWVSVRPGTGISPADERVVLGVTDTGAGIDPAVRDHIFDPFVTTKETGKGTGLGLATVRTIADAAGANIEVSSEAGHGTTIEINFPRCAIPSEPADADVADRDVPCAGYKILLVEDDGAVSASLARLLERCGMTVASAATAPEALQRLAREHFDLVLTDLVMPGMSGRDLIERLVATRPDVHIVAMSGYAPEHDLALPSCVTLLRKPFTAPQLLSALAHVTSSTSVEAAQ
jgi:PAS domain S-box-containing protein